MIWHLLWLYPLIGIVLLPRLLRRSLVREQAMYRYVVITKTDPTVWISAIMLSTVWPIMLLILRSERKAESTKVAEQEEREHEQLLESVRQERLAPDPRLAEFDILLGIEPEPMPAERVPVRIPAVRYENVEARDLYALNQAIAEKQAALLETSWKPLSYYEDVRLSDIASYRVRDIILPEEYKGVDIQSKVG